MAVRILAEWLCGASWTERSPLKSRNDSVADIASRSTRTSISVALLSMDSWNCRSTSEAVSIFNKQPF